MGANKMLSANNFKQLADKVNTLTNNEAIAYILSRCKKAAGRGHYREHFEQVQFFTPEVIIELQNRGFQIISINSSDMSVSWA